MNNILSRGLSQENVDDVLQSFFRKELPDPWPAPRVISPTSGAAKKRSWLASYSRLALVASVALVLVSYLALAARFPLEPEPGLVLDRKQTIGQKLRVPTPRGGEALLWEERVLAAPGERPTIIINVQEIKGPQKR
jgi:hypothetical protein